ncbi:MAG: GIY-YIG nuclease family protein [Brumimicrobium sp.]
MQHTVYILYSEKFDRYYVGQTNNLENRIHRHNAGYVKSTKPFRPWKLVGQINVEDRKSSVALESKIKSYKSRIKLEEIIRDHPPS